VPGPARRRALRVALLVAITTAVLPSPGDAAAAAVPPVPPTSTTGDPPACRLADVTTKFRATRQWARTQVDWIYRLPSTYRPPNLVSTRRAGIAGGGSVRAELIADLREMASAAKAAGAPIAIESAYRSYATQVATFRSWVARLGYSSAILSAARPGHSEHQLGTAIDFKSYGIADPWLMGGYDWGKTRAGRWMLANAWKYGFVLSYPSGKKAEVCYAYEPWHYRYYGRSIARAMQQSGLTPRVWLWRHGNSPAQITPTPSPTPVPSPTLTPPPAEPTPSPTPEPTPSPTPEPTPSPTPEPTPSPTPG
jgi:zinc D-Ala-D-Ala carboxypeptidase